MKRLISAILMISLAIQMKANETLYEAIKNLNIETVKKELTNKSYTKKQYEQLLESCDLSIKTWYDNTKYLSRSNKDLLLFILSVASIQIGSSINYTVMKYNNPKRDSKLYKLGIWMCGLIGTSLGIGGIIGVAKTWSMPFANKNLKIASEIKRLIQDNAY